MLSLKNDIDLEMTMSFQLGLVPWRLATADRCPVKTDKAKFLHNLEAPIDPSQKPPLEDSVYVCDGNACLQALTAIPETFEDVAERVFTLLPKTKRVDYVTDCYYENSVKPFERCRCGVAPTFVLSGPKTKTPRDWKLFMYNDENETHLIKLLLAEWRRPKYAARLDGGRLFFICEEECVCLTSNNGILVEAGPEKDLFTSQEETDTLMILHCQHIAEYHPTSVIIVRSPDTDVLVLLSKFSQIISQTILFDTGTGNKRRLLNVNYIVSVKGSDICDVLPAFHSFTGCDTTSAFVRLGKVAPLKGLAKRSQFIFTFRALGQSTEVQTKTSNELGQFVCCMYGKPKYASVNKLRYGLCVQKFRPTSGNVLSSVDGIDLKPFASLQRFSLYAHSKGKLPSHDME